MKSILREDNTFKVTNGIFENEEGNTVAVFMRFKVGTVRSYTKENLIHMKEVTEKVVDYLNNTNDIPKYKGIDLIFKYGNINIKVINYIRLIKDRYIFETAFIDNCHSIFDLYVMEDVIAIERITLI